MPPRKLTDNQIKELAWDVFYRGLFRSDILQKYNIKSKTTFREYLKRAVKMGLITEEKRLEWIANAGKRSFEGKVRKHGLEATINSCRKVWENGLGKSPNGLRKAGSLGGTASQKMHPHVIENLLHAEPYQKNMCYYHEGENMIGFFSSGERLIALLLKEYKLIDKIIPGENFYKKIGNKTVDFFIENKNLVIEYHPIPKNHASIEYKTEEEFVEDRKEDLGKEGFNGKLVVITSTAAYESYEKLQPYFKLDWQTHLEKWREVKKILDEYDRSESLKIIKAENERYHVKFDR